MENETKHKYDKLHVFGNDLYYGKQVSISELPDGLYEKEQLQKLVVSDDAKVWIVASVFQPKEDIVSWCVYIGHPFFMDLNNYGKENLFYYLPQSKHTFTGTKDYGDKIHDVEKAGEMFPEFVKYPYRH